MLTRKNVGLGLGVACILVAGCAHSPPQELRDARQAYQRAENGPAAQLNPAQLHVAERQLELAEKAWKDTGNTAKARDSAYVAMRKAQLAEVQARTLQAEREEKKWQQQAELAEQQRYQQAQEQLARAQQTIQQQQRELQEQQQRNEQTSAELARIGKVREEARGTVITLPGSILFQSGKSKLMSSAEDKLGQVASALSKVGPAARVTVEGYTDSQGSTAYNERLSQERADTVRDYLVDHGVPADRIRAVGRGEENPVADNDTAEGRANNRRVEIVVKQQNGSQQHGAMQQGAPQPGGAMQQGAPQPGPAGQQGTMQHESMQHESMHHRPAQPAGTSGGANPQPSESGGTSAPPANP